VRLYKPNVGSAVDATAVLKGPSLSFNPGLIEPANAAWTASRKPLVAQWEVVGKKGKSAGRFFTVNVHFGSKGGSSSIMGDARPPVNGALQNRLAQATLTANFVKVCKISAAARPKAAGRGWLQVAYCSWNALR
jgi:predicted extracellular nuclease